MNRSSSFARALVAGALGLALEGCVADNEALVFVAPSIEEPAIVVSAGALGTDLQGSFQLVLQLGPRASGPSQVSVQAFEITSADRTRSLVTPLAVGTETAFPVTVAPDSNVRASFTIDPEDKLLNKDKAAELCDAGGLRIVGSILDSLDDGASSPFASDVVQPTGCPQ